MLMAFAGWWTGQQQEAVAYLIEENRILRGQLRGRRLQLTDDERRRLAVRGHLCFANIASELNAIDVRPDCWPFYRRCTTSSAWSGHYGRLCPRVETSFLRFLPCTIRWVYSPVRSDASARLTVYSGCACDGGGPGGGRLSCWSSRPQSPAGIVKGSADAGGVVHGGRDGHASTWNFETSLRAWPRTTVSGALRASTASG